MMMDGSCFVLDLHAELDFNVLAQKATVLRNTYQFTQTNYSNSWTTMFCSNYLMLPKRRSSKHQFNIFGLIRMWNKSKTLRTRVEHANRYTTKAV